MRWRVAPRSDGLVNVIDNLPRGISTFRRFPESVKP
jgi:hypothetical protein